MFIVVIILLIGLFSTPVTSSINVISLEIDEEYKSEGNVDDLYFSLDNIKLDVNNYISYDGMSGPDVSTWFENLDDTVDIDNRNNLVGSCNSNDCENTIDDSFEPSSTNLDSNVNNQNRLTIRFKSEDGDTALGGSANHWKYGPAWDWQRNNNVNWDEGGFGWASAAETGTDDYISTRGLGGTQANHDTDYIFWYVR